MSPFHCRNLLRQSNQRIIENRRFKLQQQLPARQIVSLFHNVQSSCQRSLSQSCQFKFQTIQFPTVCLSRTIWLHNGILPIYKYISVFAFLLLLLHSIWIHSSNLCSLSFQDDKKNQSDAPQGQAQRQQAHTGKAKARKAIARGRHPKQPKPEFLDPSDADDESKSNEDPQIEQTSESEDSQAKEESKGEPNSRAFDRFKRDP